MKLTIAFTKYLSKINRKGHSKATQKNVTFHVSAFMEWVKQSYNVDNSRVIRKYMLERYNNELVNDYDYSS